jgi:hypothetical protein
MSNTERPPWPRKRWAVCKYTPSGHRTGWSRSFFTKRGAMRAVLGIVRESAPTEIRIERLK